MNEWGELKTRVSVSLTPTALAGLDAIASDLQLSRSDLLERIGRGEIRLSTDGSLMGQIAAMTNEEMADLLKAIALQLPRKSA